MGPGLPDATELIYNLRLLRSATKPAPGSPLMGDNQDLHGPMTRYSADFVVPIDRLEFETTPDGVRHGHLELALVAYDHGGNRLNWLFRSLKTTIRSEVYPVLQRNGAQFHEEIDLPAGENYLRAGIYDLQSDESGTLQIALNKVTAWENVAASPQEAAATSPRALAALTPASTPATSRPVTSTTTSAAESTPFKMFPLGNDSQAAWLASVSGPSAEAIEEPVPSNIPEYCATLAGTGEHSPALAKVCEFAYFVHRKLPNVVCDRETKRYRETSRRAEKMLDKMARGSADKNYFDVVTAEASYLDGREYYDHIRINGVAMDEAAPWRTGTWSIGEFASIFVSIFLPSSKPEFRFEKEDLLRSVPVLVFDFHVSADNNRSYFLASNGLMWFPEYSGKLWLDKSTFQLLRLRRETPYMPGYPIRRMRNEIDYSNIVLGDGTNLVLPTASSALVCSQSPDYCGVNIIAFARWHKFRATTKVITNPAN